MAASSAGPASARRAADSNTPSDPLPRAGSGSAPSAATSTDAPPARKPGVRAARDSAYRELIVDSAERVFATHGYEETKVQLIAAEVGMSLATIYRLYGGKWELFRAVHDRRGEQLMARTVARIQAAAGPGVTPLDVILDGLDAYIRYMTTHRCYLKMHLDEGGAWAAGGKLRSQEQVDLWNTGLELVGRLFGQGIAAGQLVADDTPELMGRTMIAMHQVRLADWVDGGMQGDVDELIRGVQRQFVRAFCRPGVASARLAALG